MGAGRARQLIAAAKTAETVEISTPLKESHAKALATVPAEKRQDVLDWAQEKSDGKPLTAAAIRTAAKETLEAEPVEDGAGGDGDRAAAEREPEPGKWRGVGVLQANEAIDALKRIPKNDALRKRAFQIVRDWMDSNEDTAT